jgi:hypothetical protein
MAIKRGNGNGGQGGRNTNNGGGDQGGAGDQGGDDDGGDDLTEAVNAAVTAHLGRKLPSILAPLVTKAIESAMAPIRDQLTTLQGGQGDQQGQGGAAAGAAQGGQQGGGAGQGGGQQGGQQGQGGGAAQDPQVKALMGQVAALTDQLKRQQEQTAAQEAEARNARRDQALTEGLTKLGVDKNRMRGAVAIARESTVWDEGTKSWVWRAQRNGYHEDLGIDAGLGEWGKGDEGKSYIAPQQNLRQGGGGGFGTQNQQRQGRQSQQQQDPAAARAAAHQAGSDKLFNQVAEMLGGGSVQIGGGGGG